MSAACMCSTYAFICGRVANYSWQLMIFISPDFTCIRALHFQIKSLNGLSCLPGSSALALEFCTITSPLLSPI